jgi:hypothetical protein
MDNAQKIIEAFARSEGITVEEASAEWEVVSISGREAVLERRNKDLTRAVRELLDDCAEAFNTRD